MGEQEVKRHRLPEQTPEEIEAIRKRLQEGGSMFSARPLRRRDDRPRVGPPDKTSPFLKRGK